MEQIWSIVQLAVTGILVPWVGLHLKAYLNSRRKLADANRIALIAETIVQALLVRFPGSSGVELVSRVIAQLKQQFPQLSDTVATRIAEAAAQKIKP